MIRIFAVAVMATLLATAGPLSAQSIANIVTFAVDHYRIEGDNPLGTARSEEILAPFTGDRVDLERLQAAAEALEDALRAAGYSFHRVTIPAQRSSSRVFTLEVLSFRIDRLEVRGNRHFSRDNVLRALPGLETGAVPDTRRLARAMRLANQHPARQLQVTMRESMQPDRIDARVDVSDVRPWRVFSSLANRGTAGTGRTRLSVGAQHANLFGRDHSATISYTTAPNHWRAVRQFGAFYHVPLYRMGSTLDASFAYSEVDSGTIAEVFDVSGSGRFFGLRYTQLLAGSDAYQHQLAVALDDRAFDDRIDFLGRPIGNDVHSRPLSFTYSAAWRTRRSALTAHLDYARNLPGGERNTATAYAAARPGARRQWDAWRYGGDASHEFATGWTLIARAEGQWANEPLISGEQFGFGGAGSLRGFDDRSVVGDDGISASIEVGAPPIAEGIRILGFIDAGRTRSRAAGGGKIRQSAASVGVGARWEWNRRLGLQIDYGQVIKGTAGRRRGDDLFHVNVTWSS